MSDASGRVEQPVHKGKAMSWLSKLFELDPAGLNWPRAVMFLDVSLVPLVVFWAIGHEEYLLSALFGLEVVALVLLMHGAATRFWNYALYCAAIAAGVLILVDLPQPSDYAAEGYRVLWTVCGAGIGLLVMLLAGLLAKRTAKTPPQPATTGNP
jgi:hypothetical protein